MAFNTACQDALNEARRKYKKQSKLEIKIEEDIMRIYQSLIRQRADINGIQYSLPGLLELESSRHYKARIRQLIGDIEGLRGLLRKREDEMGALKANWASESAGEEAQGHCENIHLSALCLHFCLCQWIF